MAIDKEQKKDNKKNSTVITQKTKNEQDQSKEKESTGLALIVERREFYRDMYSKMWKIAAVGVASMVVSIGMSVYVFNKKESSVYFATNEGGSLIKLIPLSEPNVRDSTVANWLTRALVDTFDFNYSNIKFRLNDAALKWFTSDGAAELIKAMNQNGNFDVVVDRRMIVSLETEHTPLVVKKGAPDGNLFMWKLQVPAKITYRTEAKEYSNNVIFTVTVSRRSLLEDPSGLGISRIIMTVKED
jgi:Macrophage killing protein with similarity to conjugation protein.